jgi:hypothetical protein
MPTFIGARLPAAREQEADDRAREQELRLDRHPDAVATPAAVEDLLPAGPEPRHKMLEVGHRGCRTAEHGGIERSAPRGEQAECDEAAADLEAPVRDVLVRDTIAGHVERRSEEQRERARANGGSQRRARGDVQRDDHTPIIAYAPPSMGLTDWFKRLFAPAPGVGGDDPATLRAEFGEGGFSGLARIEDAKAREDALEAEEPPSDPTP